jgi:Cu-processing system permease protein
MEKLKTSRQSNQILAIIRNENLIAKRNGWLRSFDLAFIAVGIIVIAISLLSGSSNILDTYNSVTATLLNICLYLVPLFSLCVGSITISEEKENGSMILLLSYPTSMPKVILGKYIGLILAFFRAISISLGISILMMIVVGLYGSIKAYEIFALSGLVLMSVYVSWGMLIGFLSENRMQTIGTSIAVWFVSIIIYEPLVALLCLAVPANIVNPILIVSLLVNPADCVRVLGLISMGSESVLGANLKAFIDFSRSPVGLLAYLALFAAYILIPLVFAFRQRRRIQNA